MDVYMNMIDLTRVKKMREIVKEDLKHIPRGNLDQNMFRQYYSAIRLHSLGRRANRPFSKEEVLIKSAGLINKDNPKFSPKVNLSYFDIGKIIQGCKVTDNSHEKRVCSLILKEWEKR